MGLLDELMGGLIDKEKITRDTINLTAKRLAKQYNCPAKDLAIMIKPTDDEEINFKCWIYKVEGGKPVKQREIDLSEILNGEDEDD